jgi:hypothetical protein
MLYTNNPLEREAVKRYAAFAEMRDAAWRAWLHIWGTPPTNRQIAIKLGHWSLETGRFSVGLFAWNLGNEKTRPDRHEHCYFRCNEIINGAVEWFDPPHLQTCFRAFETLWQGLVSSLMFLGVDTTPHNGRPNRYQAAWDALLAGDAILFCRELKNAGYFTANEERYTAGVVSLADEYERSLQGYAGPLESVPQDPDPVFEPDTEHCPCSDEDLDIAWLNLEVPWGEINEAKRKAYMELNDQWD